MTFPTLLLLPLTMFSAVSPQASTMRTLFSFNDLTSTRNWQAVNDGVMGGRSDGRFRVNQFKNLEFFGNLSLANNGGFASVRSRGVPLSLRAGDSIVLKVRGDGREYTFNLYTPTRQMAFSYRASFKTKPGEWTEVRIPLSKFVATSFGRVVNNLQLKPEQVSGVGILLGDKKPGGFKLEIESISVVSL